MGGDIAEREIIMEILNLPLATSFNLYTSERLTVSTSGLGCSNSCRTHLYGLMACLGEGLFGDVYNLRTKNGTLNL